MLTLMMDALGWKTLKATQCLRAPQLGLCLLPGTLIFFEVCWQSVFFS